MIRYDILPSRCGDLLVAIDERGLLHVDFVAGLRALPDMSGWRQDKVVLALFSRNLRPILPPPATLHPAARTKRHGVSASGLAGAVRHSLRRDPQLQRHRPRHRQAQCGAGGGCRQRRNPLSIIIPCHRVIGQNGSLTGYAGACPSSRRCSLWRVSLVDDTAPTHRRSASQPWNPSA